MKNSILFLALLGVLSCHKQTVEVRSTQHVDPFYIRFEAKDTLSQDYQYRAYSIGDTISIFDGFETEYHRLTWVNRLIETDGLYLFRTGIAEIDLGAVRRPIFGFDFQIPGLQPRQLPSKSMLENYFYPGRTIPFGLGPGKVNTIMRMQIDNPAFIHLSQSAYLFEPYGSMTILEVEDFEIEYQVWPGDTAKGKRITCTFEGGVGLLDFLNDRFDFPNTDVAIDIRNGEAALFIRYDE